MAIVRKAPPDRWMSLPEAAKTLGVTRHAVMTRALRGELESQTVAGRTVVARADVERMAAEGDAA